MNTVKSLAGISTLVTILTIVLTLECRAADSSSQALGFRIRNHIDHSIFVESPFGENDISYGLAYEYHDNNGLWRLGVDYTPDVSGDSMIEYAVTPNLSLIAKDGMWRGGLGILSTYTSHETMGTDWSDLYWQFLFGIALDVGALSLDVSAFYVFDDWDNLSEFDFDDIEFGAGIAYLF